MSFNAVVPAAGRGERFGGGKLVADVNGAPLLYHTVSSLLIAGASRVVVVAADPEDLARVANLADDRVTIAVNPYPDRGMFSSIQVGLAAIADDDRGAVLVLPGDMPFVKPETVGHTATECVRTSRVIVPTHAGRRGHPVAIPQSLISALIAADPMNSLKDALRAVAVPLTIDVDDPGILRDVDTRGDLDIAEPLVPPSPKHR